MSVFRNNTEALSQYLQSMVKLEELQKMTEDLDKELEDSQRLMREIKTIFNTVPNGQDRPQLNNVQRQEQLARYLAADGPQLLMPDMEEAVIVDIESLLNSLKSHAENLKKELSPQGQNRNNSVTPIENLNLEQCAASLEEFSTRFANIKLNTTNVNNRNRVLEMKLAQLCEDLNNLKQGIQASTKPTEATQNQMSDQSETAASQLCYDNLIVKLLHSVNEVSYLLKNSD